MNYLEMLTNKDALIATSLSSEIESYEVHKADKYIKAIFPNAEFMVDTLDGMLAFIPVNKEVSEIEKGYAYRHVIINNKVYEDALTSTHDELVEWYESRENKNEQMSLF